MLGYANANPTYAAKTITVCKFKIPRVGGLGYFLTLKRLRKLKNGLHSILLRTTVRMCYK